MSGETYQLPPPLREWLAKYVEPVRVLAFCRVIQACVRRYHWRGEREPYRAGERVESLRAFDRALAALQDAMQDEVLLATFRPLLLEIPHDLQPDGTCRIDPVWIEDQDGLKSHPYPDIHEINRTIEGWRRTNRLLATVWAEFAHPGARGKVRRTILIEELMHACRSFDVDAGESDDVVQRICTEVGDPLPDNATQRRKVIGNPKMFHNHPSRRR